jgi:hypothetical protein
MTQPAESTTDPAKQDPAGATPPAQPAANPDALGDAGKKALKAERDRADAAEKANKALQQQIADLQPLAALKPIAELLGGKPSGDGKTDLEKLTERVNGYETELAKERTLRWRAEVAAEKGLTAAQAARLTGDNREAMAADADALLALFPAAPQPTGPRAPAPDKTQGGSGAGEVSEIDAQIAAAEKAGDTKRAIALKTRKFAESMK